MAVYAPRFTPRARPVRAIRPGRRPPRADRRRRAGRLRDRLGAGRARLAQHRGRRASAARGRRPRATRPACSTASSTRRTARTRGCTAWRRCTCAPRSRPRSATTAWPAARRPAAPRDRGSTCPRCAPCSTPCTCRPTTCRRSMPTRRARCAACRGRAPAWFYPGGGWVDPAGLARSYLARAGDGVHLARRAHGRSHRTARRSMAVARRCRRRDRRRPDPGPCECRRRCRAGGHGLAAALGARPAQLARTGIDLGEHDRAAAHPDHRAGLPAAGDRRGGWSSVPPHKPAIPTRPCAAATTWPTSPHWPACWGMASTSIPTGSTGARRGAAARATGCR